MGSHWGRTMEGVILAIETSGDSGGAAVCRAGEVVSASEVSAPRRHGAELMQCIDRALVGAKLKREEVEVVAVNCGPGSYTGLRIGLSTAAAIGYALDVPVVGVPCFDAMALQYVMRDDFDVSLKRELWPALDARRGEVMTAKFEYDDGALERAGGDKLVAPGRLHEEAQHQAVVFGSGIPPYVDEFDDVHLFVDRDEFHLSPVATGLQAYKQLAAVGDPAEIERKPVEPRYFRRILAKTVKERSGEVQK